MNTGFLIVRSVDASLAEDNRSSRSRYSGVDRVPPYPSDDDCEKDAIEDYVFGDYKNQTTNLISSLDRALQLYRSLSGSKYKYEILFCSEGPDAVNRMEEEHLKIEHLGFDVASLRTDYWSIVADFSRNEWALHFLNALNEFGLFRGRSDAEAYLREYRKHDEPDSNSLFIVVYVCRISVHGNH